jgi:hypothetical protein
MKNNKAFKSIMEGLSESLEYTKGNITKARRMKLIDADEVLKEIKEYEDGCKMLLLDEDPRVIKQHIMFAPTVDLWKYPSKGEIPDKDWSKHPLNVSEECFVLTKRGIGTIARWDNDYRTWFENQPHLPVPDVIAWQYFEPPKEEVNG